jgi:hypothetical protein
MSTELITHLWVFIMGMAVFAIPFGLYITKDWS